MKREQIKKEISDFINKVQELYNKNDNSLVVFGNPINLSKQKICEISLRKNRQYYFEFYRAIGDYRERIKRVLSDNTQPFSNMFGFGDSFEGPLGNLYVECRIKNINSIFSKVYQYKIKHENGEIPLKKCLNDLLGFRIVVRFVRLKTVEKLLKEMKEENGWNCKIIEASKLNYKGIHLYIQADNFSLRWEIQFWLFRHDTNNRKSHAEHKQSYTTWEKEYGDHNLFEVINNGTI